MPLPYKASDVNGRQTINPKFEKITVGKNVYEPYDFSQGDPKDPEIKEKREKIKEMMLHAWNGYKLNSFGDSEVNPLNGQPKNSDLFGRAKTGLTIIGKF